MDSKIVPIIPLATKRLHWRYGFFENPQGYEAPKLRDERYLFFFSKTIYEFTLKPDAPLTFHHPDGSRIQPDRHEMETDLGSIPLTAQIFIPKDRFLLSFFFHDSGYKHHGLWFSQPGQEVFTFRLCTQWEIDNLLWRMVGAEGGNAFQRQSIYRSVRLLGEIAWNKHSPHGLSHAD